MENKKYLNSKLNPVKRCIYCEIILNTENRYNYKKNSKYICKKCNLDLNKKNPQISLKASLKWKKNNPEKVREIQRRYVKNNPEKILNRRKKQDEKKKLITKDLNENLSKDEKDFVRLNMIDTNELFNKVKKKLESTVEKNDK